MTHYSCSRSWAVDKHTFENPFLADSFLEAPFHLAAIPAFVRLGLEIVIIEIVVTFGMAIASIVLPAGGGHVVPLWCCK
jgi:hypothetical protein